MPVDLEGLRKALVVEFVKSEDPDKIWQEIQGLLQGEGEPIDVYIQEVFFFMGAPMQSFAARSTPARHDEERQVLGGS